MLWSGVHRVHCPDIEQPLTSAKRCNSLQPCRDYDRSMWPSFYPEDCPPPTLSRELTVFRFVRTDPATEVDFKSHAERFEDRVFEDYCDACGLSVFVTIDDALHAQRPIPGMKKKYIAVFPLRTEDGGAMRTGPTQGHHTWWKPEQSDAFRRFVVVSRPRSAP